MRDFDVRKFNFFNGPNYYLDRPALVFQLSIDPRQRPVDFFQAPVAEKFPALKAESFERLVDLFGAALLQVLKMDIDLFLNHFRAEPAGEDFTLAVEWFAERVAKDAVYLVSDWFSAIADGRRFDFDQEFKLLQQDFDRTLLGGPTLYSLYEAGLKRRIPIFYMAEENQFQWGYGRKQVRGRSTTFHVDSIKDTEFTMYKDMVKEFLLNCGFPTPRGKNCYKEKEILAEAEKMGYPLVVKPVAGHKGQGVVTGIQSLDEVKKAFYNILNSSKEETSPFDGAIVEQQIYGTDHRLLAVKGKFVAAQQRVPAYVDGNGTDTIATRIEVENQTEARRAPARSPLCKIKLDEDLLDYLKLQGRSLNTIPETGERVYLRRVANISQGGVSINVTDKIHPRNVKMVEDIAGFFKLTCLGIDVLAKDISKPWTDGDFGIIEINAGPGVFMHLAPAIGGSVDVPGAVMRSHFPKAGSERIPLIAGNRLSLSLCEALREKLAALRPGLGFGCLTEEGIHFDGTYFHRNERHDDNIRMMLRNPRMDFLVINHSDARIMDFGLFHQGADVVVLEAPEGAEQVLARDLLPGGWLVQVSDKAVMVCQDGAEKARHAFKKPEQKEQALLSALEPLLPELLGRYE